MNWWTLEGRLRCFGDCDGCSFGFSNVFQVYCNCRLLIHNKLIQSRLILSLSSLSLQALAESKLMANPTDKSSQKQDLRWYWKSFVSGQSNRLRSSPCVQLASLARERRVSSSSKLHPMRVVRTLSTRSVMVFRIFGNKVRAGRDRTCLQ